jgi:hypothetical protein
MKQRWDEFTYKKYKYERIESRIRVKLFRFQQESYTSTFVSRFLQKVLHLGGFEG